MSGGGPNAPCTPARTMYAGAASTPKASTSPHPSAGWRDTSTRPSFSTAVSDALAPLVSQLGAATVTSRPARRAHAASVRMPSLAMPSSLVTSALIEDLPFTATHRAVSPKPLEVQSEVPHV